MGNGVTVFVGYFLTVCFDERAQSDFLILPMAALYVTKQSAEMNRNISGYHCVHYDTICWGVSNCACVCLNQIDYSLCLHRWCGV